MKILIVGLGSIGRRHLRNLKKIAPEAEIGVWRQQSQHPDLGDLAPAVSQVFFAEQDALAWGATAALITNPAPLHVGTGLLLAEAGSHLFVEKPFSHSLEQAGDLIELCRQRALVLMVGYGFRFYPPLQRVKALLDEGRIGRPLFLRSEVGQYLPDWRPGRDYRLSVSARSDMGGGALLELSHELDCARWLMGEVDSVSAMVGRLGDLEIDVEDYAEVALRFASGAMGNVHLDMVQRPPTRTCRITGTDGTIAWDLDGHRVRVFDARAKERDEVGAMSSFDFNQVYQNELEHFLACVEGRAIPPVCGEGAYRVIEMVLAAKRSSFTRTEVRL